MKINVKTCVNKMNSVRFYFVNYKISSIKTNSNNGLICNPVPYRKLLNKLIIKYVICIRILKYLLE